MTNKFRLEIIPIYKRFWWPHVYAREAWALWVRVTVGYRYLVDGVEYPPQRWGSGEMRDLAEDCNDPR